MAPSTDRPNLSTGNLIYLYDLLKREIGCGKQTFMPAVEQALETDRMTAADLGFADTQALLEALEAFVKLTVFKGGRVYATVIAQPDWDEALACAPTAKAASKNDGKPWKRKKANKALKPARPKRVKRVEAAAEVAAKTAVEADEKADAKSPEPQAAASAMAGVTAEAPVEPVVAPEPVAAPGPTAAPDPSAPKLRNEDVFESAGPTAEPPAQEPEAPERTDEDAAPAPTREPSITLTVTYDPYSGIDEETKLESNPHVATAEPTVSPAVGTGEPKRRTDTHGDKRAVSGAKRTDRQPTAGGPAGASNATPHADVAPAHAPSATAADGPATAAAEPASAATPVAAPGSAPAAAPNLVPADASNLTPAGAPGTAPAKAPTGVPATIPNPALAAVPQSAAAPATALENDPATPSASVCAAPRPEILATYPQDVATEVYLAHERIGELCELLPYGTDVFALLAEDWKRALTLELVRGTRARITFPLRVAHADSASPIEITLKKRSVGTLKWELAGVC